MEVPTVYSNSVYGHLTNNTKELFLISGNTIASGGNIVLYPGAHASTPDTIKMSVSGNLAIEVAADGSTLFNNLMYCPAAVGYSSQAANAVFFANGAIVQGAASARRFKTNIAPLEYGLAEVLQVDTVRYNSLCPGDPADMKFIGVIADDVQPIMPELVPLDADGNVASFDYARLSVVLINAVKELSAKVTALEAQLAAK